MRVEKRIEELCMQCLAHFFFLFFFWKSCQALNCRLILGMLMGIWQKVGKQLTSSTAETFKTKDR